MAYQMRCFSSLLIVAGALLALGCDDRSGIPSEDQQILLGTLTPFVCEDIDQVPPVGSTQMTTTVFGGLGGSVAEGVNIAYTASGGTLTLLDPLTRQPIVGAPTGTAVTWPSDRTGQVVVQLDASTSSGFTPITVTATHPEGEMDQLFIGVPADQFGRMRVADPDLRFDGTNTWLPLTIDDDGDASTAEVPNDFVVTYSTIGFWQPVSDPDVIISTTPCNITSFTVDFDYDATFVEIADTDPDGDGTVDPSDEIIQLGVNTAPRSEDPDGDGTFEDVENWMVVETLTPGHVRVEGTFIGTLEARNMPNNLSTFFSVRMETVSETGLNMMDICIDEDLISNIVVTMRDYMGRDYVAQVDNEDAKLPGCILDE